MHKSKGKFLRGLKGGNLEPGQLSKDAKTAEPPLSIANDNSSANKSSLKGNKDETEAENAPWTEVRTSTEAPDWKDIIDKPPSSVNRAYEMLLMRVDDDDKEAVRVVLHLMMAARRPLTLCEMNLALNIRIRPEISDEESLELSTDNEFKQWLLHTCGFFVTICDDRVDFIDQTAKEFLLQPDLENSPRTSDGEWYHSITNRNAERMMAESCIAYLSLNQFHRRAFHDRASHIQEAQLEYESLQASCDVYPSVWAGDPVAVDSAYDEIFTDFRFLHYALGFWARHFRECQYIDEAAVVDVGNIFFDKYLELFATTSTGPPSWLLVTLY